MSGSGGAAHDAPAGPGAHAVGDVLDELVDAAARRDRVRLGTLVETLGHRGTGALLLVPALLEISPLGAVPGVPTALASLVLLFAVQIVLGRSHMWLPGFVERRCIGADRLGQAAEKMRPAGERLDRWFHGRLRALVGRPFTRIAALGCALLALTVPVLEVVPFASTLPMGAIAMFGLALLVRDGALMVVAIVASFAALWSVASIVLG